jgi:predicted Rdx family selenoprotein
MGVVLPVGTRKGLFLLRSDDRTKWEVEGPLLEGWAVNHAIVDPRDRTLHAATNNPFYGATAHRSSDGGKSWERADELGLPEDGELKLNATWHIEPGRDSELWLGGDPGVLFRSGDGGRTWQLNQGLFEHPTRDRWQPGAGGMCTHSIQLVDGAMYVAISAAGAFRSEDGGDSWTPINKHVAAEFMPDPYPDVGQCVHKLLAHPKRPERLWQQNHCGVYRSDDRGDSWERLDGNGLPSGFGYPIMLDPNDPDTAYVIPERSMEYHYPPEARLCVYRTRDKGRTWDAMSDGLPGRAWTAVLREASAYDAESLYFGTQSGSFFALVDGDTWFEAVCHLPPILSVEVSEWPR